MKPKIKHTPYDLGLGFALGVDCAIRVSSVCLMETVCERLNLFWELEGAEKPILLIQFQSALVARLLDEMPASTETNPERWEGVDGSFARIVHGNEYPTGSDALFGVHREAKHYGFVTDDDCVDVIATDTPRARLIDIEDIPRYRLQFPLAY